jgi:hypothetical protein
MNQETIPIQYRIQTIRWKIRRRIVRIIKRIPCLFGRHGFRTVHEHRNIYPEQYRNWFAVRCCRNCPAREESGEAV